MRIVKSAALIVFVLGALSCSHATQSRAMWVSLEQSSGAEIASFVPREEPYSQNGPAIGSAPFPSAAKLSDGRSVSWIAVRGWREGEGARVVIFAVVPRPDAKPDAVLDSENTSEIQIATYLLAPGQTRVITEMQAYGVEPYKLHYAPASPQS